MKMSQKLLKTYFLQPDLFGVSVADTRKHKERSDFLLQIQHKPQ